MAKRFSAITDGLTPERVTVVLVSDYDELRTQIERLQDNYDRLRASIAARGYHRVSGCEQEAGEPFCNCAVVFERAHPLGGQAEAREPRGEGV